MPAFVTLDELKSRLAPLLHKHEESAVVFDADGTLWSHDVGCMVFDVAVEEGVFREEALPSLLEEARRHRLAISGETANDAARSLLQAWYSRRYNERAAAEVQVWAYVGVRESEFRELTRRALAAGRHLDTLHQEVLELADWVRESGRRTCIVSASPLWVVQEAVQDLGFDREEIAAGLPHTKEFEGEQVIQSGMKEPLPYGPDKVVAGRTLLRGATWLSTLGDSNFDLEMMGEARIGVGIGEKESMLEGLAKLPQGVRLRLEKA